MRRRVAQVWADQGRACLSAASLRAPRPIRATQRARVAGRRIRLAFLLLTFLWRSKEQVSRRRGETRTGSKAKSTPKSTQTKPTNKPVHAAAAARRPAAGRESVAACAPQRSPHLPRDRDFGVARDTESAEDLADVFLHGPLAEEPVFPPMVVQMIAVGEDSGSLEVMLSKVSDFYDSEVQATTEALTSLIEPLLIAFLGIVVGGMIIALYLPIFSIATVVK